MPDARGRAQDPRIAPVRRLSWASAGSFEELCELGARFVEGRLRRFPGWGAPALDEESEALVPVLARLNRAGLLTLASQPARARDAGGYEQRAFASGFAQSGSARRWQALARRGLRVRTYARGVRGRAAVAVSRQGGQARVLAGHDAFEIELELFAAHVGAGARAELERCVYWSAWDPAWGREELLWSALERAWC